MMHYKPLIVTICDNSGKTLREYDTSTLSSGRESKVRIPFDSEYKFKIKNQSFTRYRLVIEIDGSDITEGGIVVSAYQDGYIERFVSSDRKFKFVRLSNSGVADPTAKENGLITIKAYPEKPPKVAIRSFMATDGYSKGISQQSYGYNTKGCVGQDALLGSIQCSAKQDDRGATVEGMYSNQIFTNTTWEGDDNSNMISFVFRLSGYELNQSTIDKQQELLDAIAKVDKLKAELGL